MVRFEGKINLYEVSDQAIPFPRIRDMVLRDHSVIGVLDCACRGAVEAEGGTPCAPRRTCMIMGRVHTAWFKDANGEAVIREVFGKMGVRPEHEAVFRKRYQLSPRPGTPPRT